MTTDGKRIDQYPVITTAPAGFQLVGNDVTDTDGGAQPNGSTKTITVEDMLKGALGQPLALTGAVQAARFAGGTTTGAPVTGTFDVGDFVVDQSGEIWVCTVAGSPGTWVNAGGSGGGSGVSSFNGRSGAVTPGNSDYLAVASGGLTGATAAARFVGGTASGAPAAGTFAAGDFVVDQSGTMWLCVAAGSPGTWTSLVNTTAAQTVSGALTVSAGSSSVPALLAENPTTTTYVPAFHAFGPNGQFIIFRVGAGLFGNSAEFSYANTSPRAFILGFNGGPQELGFDDTGFIWTGAYGAARNTLDDGAGNMTLKGGLSTSLRTVTASATLTATDSVVLLNGSALTATLPDASGIKGRTYTLKLIAASTATVATTSAQTIDGASTYSLSAQYKHVTVVSDGSNWLITGAG